MPCSASTYQTLPHCLWPESQLKLSAKTGSQSLNHRLGFPQKCNESRLKLILGKP